MTTNETRPTIPVFCDGERLKDTPYHAKILHVGVPGEPDLECPRAKAWLELTAHDGKPIDVAVLAYVQKGHVPSLELFDAWLKTDEARAQAQATYERLEGVGVAP